MKEYIHNKLQIKWSPELISGRMKINLGKSISHETIYRYIKADKLNGGKLFKLLAHRGKKYKYGSSKCTTIIDRIDISERPKVVETKTRMGDFEIDTMVSAKNTGKSCLFTMVDRRSKKIFIRKTLDKSAAKIQAAIEDIYLNTTVPIITLTSDNGTEFANHKVISANINCDFYFARPYRSSDRGLNEHMNGQIRRYLPKGTNFDTISVEELSYIENSLNDRPRKSLNYRTPNEVTNKYLQRILRNQELHKNMPVAFHV
jgi:IS30 family transposase